MINKKKHQNAFYWFTLPEGHTITETLAATRTDGGHSKSFVAGRGSFNQEWGGKTKDAIASGNATYGPASGKEGGFDRNFASIDDVTNTNFIARAGSSQRTDASPTDSRSSEGYYYLGPTQGRFYRWERGTGFSNEFYKKSERIIGGLKQHTSLLYYFALSTGKVQLSYITHTDTPYAPIYYGTGMRSIENNDALMYFTVRGLQEKPNAPTVNTNKGTVTVTPYSNQNQNVDKVELSYTDKNSKSKMVTLIRDARNGTWTAEGNGAEGIEIKGDSFSLKAGAAKAGTEVSAKSYFGNSDASDTNKVAVPTPQNTQHNPQAKNPKQSVSRGATPSAGASVDTNGLPDGTTYEWKEGHKPDTNTSKTNPPGDKDGVVVVTYPDGTTDEVAVKVTVTAQNTQHNPQAKDPKQAVSKGATPSAGASVDTNGLPDGTTYEWKEGHKPDTNTSKTNPPGDKDGVVVVTYPDGTTDEVNVTVKVTGQDFTPAKPGQGMVPRPNPTPTPRPDDSANTDNGGTTSPAGSNSNSVTPDNSGNTPTHSEDSTNQAASQSTQQRGTGNATAPESPQGLSGSSATPAARSRRSVAFAGGAQSSQEKQVDKSVLRDLIQDLETRLKDLDGIDQSVIDAAKIILGEGQEALRNTDLTEAGLREITAKVKEALESLKGKQATKDKEATKETRKEQGHLPYGTMISSLLALLGLLLFLIARRKKESELKKLTKELTKVLQASDLTSVDAKVLDQAREALAQAVAFLANEKESDHTEDELIEKLKAILAQLR
ncbi:Rib/alpha-like domain-containing protein [Streptococcus pseudopneumoniae]|uniref:Rib/alpha-like domain-containing protein n=1 Tax=Streptococcus pseudopneumoniae TaxID=257758 RepID=UPI001BB0E2D1|nr:Rib/alpha-like domain-containing protein [Streptococcus pseudopneumoniae]